MKRTIFSIYFTAAMFFNSLIFTLIMAIGLIFKRNKLSKKIYTYRVASQWARNSFRLTFSPVSIEGMENIDYNKNYLILSNHASNADIFLLLGYLGLRSIFISKRVNFKIPIVGLAMTMMGCIPINRNHARSALESMDAAVKSYQGGDSIIIFPEGTRSPDGNPIPFKSGFLHLISKSPMWILPVTLSGTSRVQSKASWLVYPSRIKVVVHKPLMLSPGDVNNPANRQSVLNRLQDIISSEFVKDYK